MTPFQQALPATTQSLIDPLIDVPTTRPQAPNTPERSNHYPSTPSPSCRIPYSLLDQLMGVDSPSSCNTNKSHALNTNDLCKKPLGVF